MFFLYLENKNIFDIFNTLIYASFIVLVQFHAAGTFKKINLWMFLAVNIVIWFFVPSWGQNILWLTGSCIYLWPTVFILLFLVPFRKKFDSPAYKLNVPLSVLFFLLGILAGWSVENSGAAVFFLLIAYFVTKTARKERLDLFEILGALGFLIGFTLLIAAPGNYVRIDASEEISMLNDPFYVKLVKRFFNITRIFLRHSGPMAAISGILAFDLIFRQKKKIDIFIWFYALAGLASVYSMLLSPYFPERAYFIVVVFFTIVLLGLASQIRIQMPPIIERNRYALGAFFLVIFLAYSFLPAGKNIVGVYLKWKQRSEHILAQKAQGNLDIVVKAPIPVHDKHVALYGLRDVFINDPAEEWNVSIARYFSVNSIDGVENNDPW
jgi:hypothetical protein